MGPLIALIVSALVSAGAIFVVLKYLRQQASKSVGKERAVIRAEIDLYDRAIEAALERLTAMSSLDDVGKLEQEKEVAQKKVEEERGKVKTLENSLKSLQERVDKQEARHNELKKGREDCDRIADEIRSSKEILEAEFKKLQGELSNSRLQMNSLSAEAQLTAEQKAAVNGISSAIEKLGAQLAELVEIYGLTSSRYANLQHQYAELEKEYRKLVDKELSGENTTES